MFKLFELYKRDRVENLSDIPTHELKHHKCLISLFLIQEYLNRFQHFDFGGYFGYSIGIDDIKLMVNTEYGMRCDTNLVENTLTFAGFNKLTMNGEQYFVMLDVESKYDFVRKLTVKLGAAKRILEDRV